MAGTILCPRSAVILRYALRGLPALWGNPRECDFALGPDELGLSMIETSEPYSVTVSGFAFMTDSREVLVDGPDMQ